VVECVTVASVRHGVVRIDQRRQAAIAGLGRLLTALRERPAPRLKGPQPACMVPVTARPWFVLVSTTGLVIHPVVPVGLCGEPIGPVLASLMVAGRVGAAIAAEIGTMRVTEQIDALETLATNPMKYLVVPRLLAGILMLPALALVADVIGIMGGFLVSVFILDFNESAYLTHTNEILKTMDVVSGLIKASVFGLIVTLLGCFNGYHSRGGAQGVGVATMNAVVSASVLIFFTDYFMTELFFSR